MNVRDKEYISPELMPSFYFPFLAFLLFFFGSYYFLLSVTWSIHFPSTKPLGAFSSHVGYLMDGAVYFAGFAGKGNSWEFYVQSAKGSGAWGSVVTHIMVPAIASLAIAVLGGRIVYAGMIPKLRHVGGLQYFHNPSFAMSQLTRGLSKADGKLKRKGVPIHPEVAIDRERDNRGLLVVGGMGSGKTQVLLPRVNAIREQNHRLFINDSKGEYTELIEGDFVLVAAWDSRSVKWDIAADVCDRPAARILAEQYIKESHDPMWSSAARQVLVGMLVYLIETRPLNWGFEHLKDVMTMEAEKLADIISEHNPEALQTIRNLESETGKTAEGIMINLQSFMSPFYDMANAWNGVGGFSVRKWLQEDYKGPRTVIVQGSERFKTLSQGLASALLSFVITDMADPSFPEAKSRKTDYRVYFNLDEFPTMGRVPLIERLISVCRSKGAFVILAFQDISQGFDLYGKDLLNTWITNLSNKVIGSTAIGPSASFICSEILGEREVLVPSSSLTFDQHGNPSRTISHPKDRIPVLKPNELSEDLGFSPNKNYGFCLYTGERLEGVYRLKWSKNISEQVRPPVVFADWVTTRSKDVKGTSIEDSFPLDTNLESKSEPQGQSYFDRRNFIQACREHMGDLTGFDDKFHYLSDLFLRGRISTDEYTERLNVECVPFRDLRETTEEEKLELLLSLENTELVNEGTDPIDHRQLRVIIRDLEVISYKINDEFRAKEVEELRKRLSNFSTEELEDKLLRQNISSYIKLRNSFRLKESY